MSKENFAIHVSQLNALYEGSELKPFVLEKFKNDVISSKMID